MCHAASLRVTVVWLEQIDVKLIQRWTTALRLEALKRRRRDAPQGQSIAGSVTVCEGRWLRLPQQAQPPARHSSSRCPPRRPRRLEVAAARAATAAPKPAGAAVTVTKYCTSRACIRVVTAAGAATRWRTRNRGVQVLLGPGREGLRPSLSESESYDRSFTPAQPRAAADS